MSLKKATKTHFLNRLMLSTGKLTHNRYYSFIKHVDVIQHRKLLRYISGNRFTVYGKEFDFKNIHNYASYAAKVPIIEDWKQINGYIKRIEKGEQNIICRTKIDAFEETSGNTGCSKLIPYNKSLKKEFEKALQVWMLDLYSTSPQCFYGKAYWSVSPVLKETRYTACGIKIGMENDAEYFHPLLRYLLSQTMAAGSSITKIKEPGDFYFQTIKQLLLQHDLSFISVWSPTFFLRLDEFLRENLDVILKDIYTINIKRHHQICKAAKTGYTWKNIWPNLSGISCWTDAQASVWMARLKRRVGDVPLQPKGLLSTEAVISIPIRNVPYPALAYQSHFFEFRDVDDYRIHLAHQLVENACYEVIVTTAGGLYRYATKDVVQVKGYHYQVPLLKFLGRQNRTSDMVGEKVNEVQVNEIINEVLSDESVNIDMVFIRPEMLEQSGVYTLYIEDNGKMDEKQAEKLTKRFEKMLCQNPYYNQALNTGQLKAMRYKILAKGFKEQLTNYYREKKLIKDGDVKLPVLFLIHELDHLNYLL